MNRKQQIQEWEKTAENINSMDKEERENLGKHLIAKYSNQMISSLKDRVNGLASGFKIDKSTTQMLEQIGITL